MTADSKELRVAAYINSARLSRSHISALHAAYLEADRYEGAFNDYIVDLAALLSTNEALARENERRGDALTRLMAAVVGLTKRTLDGVVFFEASPLDSDAAQAAWQELDAAVKAARQSLEPSHDKG